MEQVEEFIAIKSLFLLLQVLFELRMKSSAKPILDLLEVKMAEIERLIEKKKLIKNQHNSSVNTSQEATSKASEKEVTAEMSEESKSWTTTGSIYEGLDESITSKNSFCIIIGAFIRRNAVSPKTVNLFEYQMLLSFYRAMLSNQKSERDALIK